MIPATTTAHVHERWTDEDGTYIVVSPVIAWKVSEFECPLLPVVLADGTTKVVKPRQMIDADGELYTAMVQPGEGPQEGVGTVLAPWVGDLAQRRKLLPRSDFVRPSQRVTA